MYELIKKRKNIFGLKAFLLACFLFSCLFLSETKTSQAVLGTAECNARGGSCDFTCIGSDYESLGDCDYGMKICCRKKLVDTSGDPDPKGTGNFTAGTCGSSGEGTCKYNVAIGGTICGDDKNIGQDNCPWSYSCCVPKVAATTDNTSQPAATNNTNPSTQSSQPASANTPATQANPAVGTGYVDIINNGLVPCGTSKYPAPCTLCHLIVGFHRIFTFLLGLLITATLLAITGAGVFYMVSTGNKGMMDKAKQALTYALTAFALGLGSWLVVTMILTAFGFNNAGSWWNFSCDATQSQGASSVANNVSGSGGALGNIIYEFGKKYYDSNGILHTDCSGYAEERRIAAGLGDPGRGTADQMKNAVAYNESQLRAGSLIFSNSSRSPSGRHVAVYNGDGTVSHNSGKGVNVVTVSLGQYLNNRSATGMLI